MAMQFRPLFVALFILNSITGLFVSCSWDPQRNNPADPGSPNYRNTGHLTLEVRDSHQAALADVTVYCRENGATDITDQSGIALLEVPIGLVHLDFQKPEFETFLDSLIIQYGSNSEKSVQLNALPVIDSIRIVSGFDEFQPNSRPGDFNRIYEVSAWVHDLDGNETITSVSYYDSVSSERISLNEETDGVYIGQKNFGDNAITSEAEFLSRLNRRIVVTAVDNNDGQFTVEGSLNGYLRYTTLLTEMHLPNESGYTTPSFWFDNPNVGFRPVSIRMQIVHEITEEVEYDTLFFADYSNDSTWIDTEAQLETGNSYYWYHWLIDPTGDWVRTRLRFSVNQPNPGNS